METSSNFNYKWLKFLEEIEREEIKENNYIKLFTVSWKISDEIVVHQKTWCVKKLQENLSILKFIENIRKN